jgi:hypothetical protein
MPYRSLARRVAITLAVVATAGPLSAQTSAPAKLMGSWVMDTTNGSDDHGLPKSESLVFSLQPNGFHLVATEDDGKGPGTSTFDCAPGGASTTLSPTQVMLCTIHLTADSVLYTLDVLNNGQTVSTERGRLVVSQSGQMLRDQYDATSGSARATHHRHVYVKQP